jgi:hypothetical protein
MSMLNRLFPETLFPRKLSADAEQRVRLAQARAEEALIRTHVENALHFVDTLAPDVGYERALDIYVRELALPDPLASVVVTRALVSLGDALHPAAAQMVAAQKAAAQLASPSVESSTHKDNAPPVQEPAAPTAAIRLAEAAARRRQA